MRFGFLWFPLTTITQGDYLAKRGMYHPEAGTYILFRACLFPFQPGQWFAGKTGAGDAGRRPHQRGHAAVPREGQAGEGSIGRSVFESALSGWFFVREADQRDMLDFWCSL